MLAATISLVGCGNSTITTPIAEKPTEIEIDSYGTDQTLDLLTWNLQNFPKDENTVPYLTQIIPALNIDLYALQEISPYFSTLLDSLPGYQGFKANSASYDLDLAYIYNPENITINDSYEIYQNEWYAFPRAPLVLEIEYNSIPITIINNHLKCCNGEDNEIRRTRASLLLEEYIEENLQNQRVVVMGDWNDTLDFFQNFQENTKEYMFADTEIASSPEDWSYPSYPSHIDHILITDELFNVLNNSNSSTDIIKLENYLENGWSEYYSTLSDHRPIAIKLDFE